MIDPTKRSNRPGTKLLDPPTKPARKESEQVPAGDDSDINEGRDYIQPEDVRDDRPGKKKDNKPVEKDSDKDENSGCAC